MEVKLFSPSDLGHLGGKCREIVELVCVEGRDTKAVSRRTLLPETTIRSHIRHARARLAGKGIILPDRRFASPTQHAYAAPN